MIWQDCQIDSGSILKAIDDITLWKTERGIVQIEKDTLAIRLKLKEQREGYVFHGHGKLLLDTIVETEEGALGKSVEKELSKPFLMVGDIKETQQHFTTASNEDLVQMGYEDSQKFADEAQDLLDRLFRGRVHGNRRFGKHDGFIFAFQNEADEFDILVVRGSKLVYKAEDIVFVLNRNKAALKSPNEVVVARGGKMCVIEEHGSFRHCCC
jgi:hypothetical protein